MIDRRARTCSDMTSRRARAPTWRRRDATRRADIAARSRRNTAIRSRTAIHARLPVYTALDRHARSLRCGPRCMTLWTCSASAVYRRVARLSARRLAMATRARCPDSRARRTDAMRGRALRCVNRACVCVAVPSCVRSETSGRRNSETVHTMCRPPRDNRHSRYRSRAMSDSRCVLNTRCRSVDEYDADDC